MTQPLGYKPNTGDELKPDALVPVSPTLESARSLMAYMTGDATLGRKGEYLSYRLTGFSVREAVQFIGVHQFTVMRWRKADPEFLAMEHIVTGEQRQELRKEVIQLLFFRNYHLVLKKDFEVIRKALGFVHDAEGQPMLLTKAELEYLFRARQHYTPQQLQALESMLKGDTEGFDYAKFIKKLAEHAAEVTVEHKTTIRVASTDGQDASAPSVSHVLEGVLVEAPDGPTP